MRNHDLKFECYERGESNTCSIDLLGAGATLLGGALGGLFGDDDDDSNVSYSVYDQDTADRILSDAEALYNAGALVPLPNEITLTGRESVLDYATGQLPGLVSSAQESWQQGLSGEISPYTQSLIDAAQQDLIQEYQRTVLPGIANNAIQYGGYGGSRQGLAQGVASEGLLDSLADVETEMLNNAYNQSLEQQQAAWSVLNDMLSAGTLPGYLQQEVGGQYTEDERNAAANLEAYQNLVSGYTTPMASTGSGSSSTLSNIVGGASTGYGIYDALRNSNTGLSSVNSGDASADLINYQAGNTGGSSFWGGVGDALSGIFGFGD